MEGALQLEVPSPSDISLGPDWGTLIKVDKSDSLPDIKE